MVDSPIERGRAWIEIDLDALSHNIADIRSKAPRDSEIMAIVKANAYGHGLDKIAERMVQEGINTFGVATINEGIQLRQSAPTGDILVFGRVHIDDVKLLSKYRLSQLVVDGAHAKFLSKCGHQLDVHIAIDTGMHRLGLDPSNFDEIESIFSYSNLSVKGLLTHFASADSFDDDDISFTHTQIKRFYTVVSKLKEKGYDVGKLHAQSSYAIYNYPELKCDYIRPGIMLYGVHSQSDDTKITTNLRPVLSLRANIAQVKWIGIGESVSYSRIYTSDKPSKIATVCIGYADGVPRQMSGSGAVAIVKGQKVPIVGRICMDLLMLDVTDVGHVEAGDVITIIGKDGDSEIRCEDVAAISGTITNDVLTGLASRLPRIYV
ncbi:MAG: serine racemase VanT catalytic subunit [Oscillospiraceae bacterium]|nr:serine racemase VanT catalytic subunit [Oscillospiraceae bacterium]